MQLLWTILRIIGILILAVILLVLLVVLSILFVPIRYRVWAQNITKDKPYGKVSIHWLLHLISLTGEYGEELTYRLNVLGFTLFDEKKGKGEKKAEELITETEPKAEEPATPIKSAEKIAEQNKPKKQEQETDSTAEEKTTLWDKIEGIWIKFMEFISAIPEKIAGWLEKWADFQENIGDRVDALIDKIDQWNRKKDRLMRQIRDEQNQFAVKEIFRTVGKLLGHIRPRKLRVKGRLGFDDPARTGQIFGIIGMLMPLYGEHIQLEAVFDEKVMEGGLYLSGRIRIGSLLWLMIRLILRKEVRRLIRQIRHSNKSKTQENTSLT